MKIILRFLVLALVAATLAATARARSPEETLEAYVAAVRKDGITAAVRFIHADELAAFRKELEPELAKRVKNSRTRQQYSSFCDPYKPKQLRPFKDDIEFTVVFLNWMSTSGMAAITTYENATMTPLGCVVDGELRHVVARFTLKMADQTANAVTVTSMKMNGGQPMLLLLPELRQVANMVRQGR